MAATEGVLVKVVTVGIDAVAWVAYVRLRVRMVGWAGRWRNTTV